MDAFNAWWECQTGRHTDGTVLDLKNWCEYAFLAGRAAGLEEAAKVCDEIAYTISPVRAKLCADSIRSLITKAPE